MSFALRDVPLETLCEAVRSVARTRPFAWTPRQRECIDTLAKLRLKGNIPRVLYGGAMGGGKSWLLCALTVQTCEQHPGARVYLCRRESVVFKRTTLQVLLNEVGILDRSGWRHAISDQYFAHDNGSRIDYGGLADNADREKIKSLNLSCAGIDEASEVDQVSARLLESRVGRIAAVAGSEWVLYVSNPEPCWLEAEYVSKQTAGRAYVQALPTDNPHLGEAYVAHLRQTYSDMPDLLDAYLNGVWGAIGAYDRVYPPVAVTDAMQRKVKPGRPITWGVDVARYGDDATVIYEVRGESVRMLASWRGRDTRQTSDKIAVLFNATAEAKPRTIAIDDCGIGGAVTDNLRHAGLPVTPINVAERATDPEKFANQRAELAWRVRDLILGGKLALPNDDDLRLELTAMRYLVRNGKLTVERKDELKQRIGRSPDRADALILAVAVAYEVSAPAYGSRVMPVAAAKREVVVLPREDGPGNIILGRLQPNPYKQTKKVAYGD